MEKRPIVNLAKIRGLMAEHGDTQEKVASFLNQSVVSFSKRINGEIEFKPSELYFLAKKYKKPIEYFFC